MPRTVKKDANLKPGKPEKPVNLSDRAATASWKQTTHFSAPEDWIFASPFQVGRLPYSYTGVKQELQRAADAASLGHLRSHTFRHTHNRDGVIDLICDALESLLSLFGYVREQDSNRGNSEHRGIEESSQLRQAGTYR